MAKKNIVWFEEVDKHDVGLVGGKGANLGEMTGARLPIPYGFIITSYAYFDFIKKTGIDKKIKQFILNLNSESPDELKQISSHIRSLFYKQTMPPYLVKELIRFYDNLLIKEKKYFSNQSSFFKNSLAKIKSIYRVPLVAVRSSATAEDLPTASFAGQQETYLNVRGDSLLIN